MCVLPLIIARGAFAVFVLARQYVCNDDDDDLTGVRWGYPVCTRAKPEENEEKEGKEGLRYLLTMARVFVFGIFFHVAFSPSPPSLLPTPY